LFDFVRRAIAAEDDLLLGVVKGIERVEKLVLRPFLAGQKLHVVDEQHVDAAVALAEIDQRSYRTALIISFMKRSEEM
jgi:hypothetical protein